MECGSVCSTKYTEGASDGVKKRNITITGKIDLTGYSYYPVTPIGAVNLGTNQGNTTTSLNFDYDGMNEKENWK